MTILFIVAKGDSERDTQKVEPERDTQKVKPESIKVFDLDPETLSTLEKMMELDPETKSTMGKMIVGLFFFFFFGLAVGHQLLHLGIPFVAFHTCVHCIAGLWD